MALKHLKTAEFDAAVEAAPLAMVVVILMLLVTVGGIVAAAIGSIM